MKGGLDGKGWVGDGRMGGCEGVRVGGCEGVEWGASKRERGREPEVQGRVAG